MSSILSLLKNDPFTVLQKEKEKIFHEYIRAAARWQYTNNKQFRNLCDNRNFDVSGNFNLTDLPYFPVTLFKKFDLLSVPQESIIKTLYSSSTSGQPSKIMIDKETATAQVLAINTILKNFFGNERMTFIIFDSENVIKSNNGELSSRGVAIRGMLSLAKHVHFILDENLNLDEKKLKHVLENSNLDEKVCFFGFTWLLYVICADKKSTELLRLFYALHNKENSVLHIGGWKKLKDKAVTKDQFNLLLSEKLGVSENQVVDFYGMTEQLGTVYPDCRFGFKHVPLYSELIVRYFDTLEPVKIGEIGLMQFISPIPHSYPGISLLSDDVGRIVGVDTCQCGRKGKYFVFEKRSEKAEVRGCGDTLLV